jgi:hypothetical protein
MIERVRKAFKEGRLLEEFVPVPKDLHIVAGRVGDDTDPNQIALEAQERLTLRITATLLGMTSALMSGALSGM